MGICTWRSSSALLLLSAATASAQQTNLFTDSAPIVQPGAPGQSGKILSPATARVTVRAPSAADISFMQGMIMHHFAGSRDDCPAPHQGAITKTFRELGYRHKSSRRPFSEMRYMKQWLEDRGQPVSMNMGGMNTDAMKGMDHSSMPNM